MIGVSESTLRRLHSLPATFILWDIDHTLVENSGVSKEVYSLAFKLLTNRVVSVLPVTDGRTEFQIMKELLEANEVDASGYASITQFEGALREAMTYKALELQQRGHALKGAMEALLTLASVPTVVQSVLTGNILSNARTKLYAFGLDAWIDFDVGGYGSDHSIRSKLVDIAREKARRKHGIEFDRTSTILVGDTPLDIKAAHDGGAKLASVATGTSSMGELAESGADAVLA